MGSRLECGPGETAYTALMLPEWSLPVEAQGYSIWSRDQRVVILSFWRQLDLSVQASFGDPHWPFC